MRNYFEEMNIDYNELKRYEDIETYYDEVEDYTKLIKELQCDRVEALKQIVNKNREIERLKEENTILKQTMSSNSLLINENAFLKERNEKAIEYIENCHGMYRNTIRDIQPMINIKPVLDILKEGEKE